MARTHERFPSESRERTCGKQPRKRRVRSQHPLIEMVNPTISALDLLLGAAALAGLIVVRFYYLPGETK